MNAFFAAVEQACNPGLRGKPIFVCGRGRTVVTTASYEARAYGVKTGMSKYEALKLCPRAIPVVGNFEKYIDTSERIWKLLIEWTDRVEVYSIDEAFVDVTDIAADTTFAAAIARAMKVRIRDEFKLTCSIGIAPNKLVAKLASEMQKPDGLVLIRPEEVAALMERLPVEKLCGIGERTRRHLAMLGIRTAGELASARVSFLYHHFGYVGYFLKQMGRGHDDSPVGRYGDPAVVKSVGHSYTLPRNTLDERVIRSYLLWLCDKVGRRLRQAGFAARVVHAYLRYGDFSSVGKQHALARHITGCTEIYAVARRIIESYKPYPAPIRLLGVSVSDLMYDTGQLCLFEEDERRRACERAVDQIRDRYGEESLFPVSVLARSVE